VENLCNFEPTFSTSKISIVKIRYYMTFTRVILEIVTCKEVIFTVRSLLLLKYVFLDILFTPLPYCLDGKSFK